MKVIFRVCAWKWENAYSCLVMDSIEDFDDFHSADKFCIDYDGEYSQIFIQKFYEKEQ